ncbi:MAG TPA: hypothetical protein DCZ94_14090 [Lentisphaeria bacterium]|nr:MAG: hypothetical protein A2X48_10175 [Lentisphaerae bacterium GWF2_49_21]HBC88076.1 hypothetical protein [Lentisphaeria bacterium]
MSLSDKDKISKKTKPNLIISRKEELENLEKDGPAVRYVDILIYSMIKEKDYLKIIDSKNLPVIDEYKEVDYKHVLNRIKVMAGLNPYPYREKAEGIITLRVAGVPYTAHVTVAPNDESARIQIEKDNEKTDSGSSISKDS